jgi:tRNA pseudouridine55 synthase
MGHAGTLDPAATGVLPVAIGTASRLIPYLSNEKIYLAEVLLGTKTTTDDLCGSIIQQQKVPDSISQFEIESVLKNFVGQLQQKPPLYSAIKQNGQRGYDLARKKLEKRSSQPNQSQAAETVGNMLATLKPRQVDIKQIELLQTKLPVIQLRITCSSGTYIRALARDIGELFGCGGCLKSLLRERSGVFTLENAIKLETIQEMIEAEQLQQILLAPAGILQTNIVSVDRAAAETLVRGGFLPMETVSIESESAMSVDDNLRQYCLAVYKNGTNFDQTIALCLITENELIKPKVVLVNGSLFQ